MMEQSDRGINRKNGCRSRKEDLKDHGASTLERQKVIPGSRDLTEFYSNNAKAPIFKGADDKVVVTLSMEEISERANI